MLVHVGDSTWWWRIGNDDKWFTLWITVAMTNTSPKSTNKHPTCHAWLVHTPPPGAWSTCVSTISPSSGLFHPGFWWVTSYRSKSSTPTWETHHPMMADSGNMLQIVTRITRMGVLTNTHFCPASTRILNKNCHLPSGYTLVIKHGSAVVDVPWFSTIVPYCTNYVHDFPIFHQHSPIISMIFPWISHACPIFLPPSEFQPLNPLLLCLQAATPGDQSCDHRATVCYWTYPIYAHL